MDLDFLKEGDDPGEAGATRTGPGPERSAQRPHHAGTTHGRGRAHADRPQPIDPSNHRPRTTAPGGRPTGEAGATQRTPETPQADQKPQTASRRPQPTGGARGHADRSQPREHTTPETSNHPGHHTLKKL